MNQPLPKNQECLTGLILAGGQSQRMLQRDKGLVELDHRPLIEYVIKAMQSQVDELLINANHSSGSYKNYGLPVIPDIYDGHLGPLAGIASGLYHASHELVFTAPCDAPLLSKELGHNLYLQLTQSNTDICIAHDGIRVQPLFGIYRIGVLKSIDEYLSSGQRSVRNWLKNQNFSTVDFSEIGDTFSNINTPQELKQVAQQIRD